VETLLKGALVVVPSVALVIILLLVVRRRWPAERLQRSNAVASAYSQVIGTIYAVIMAFMLYAVWVNYGEAHNNAEREANVLVSIFRMADGLPSPERDQIRGLCREYAQFMVRVEWRAMVADEFSPVGSAMFDRLWQIFIHLAPRTAGEQVLHEGLLTQMAALAELRRIRELQITEQLPGLLWTVLLVGGVLTVGFSYLFGVEDTRLHVVKTAALTGLVALVLFAIWQISEPFQGVARIRPTSFRLALRTFDRVEGK
jgi:hypothetical protein